MKMDAALKPSKATDGLLYIQDLKTGKPSDSHEEQGDLYATIGAAKYPKAKGVEVEFWYSQTGDVATLFYDVGKKQIRRIQKWTERGHRILDPKQRFLPSPTPEGCKWCHVRSDKGGPCDAWKRLRF
jgi:hypothetical protein